MTNKKNAQTPSLAEGHYVSPSDLLSTQTACGQHWVPAQVGKSVTAEPEDVTCRECRQSLRFTS